jgi:DNA end-binding protein Ku
MRPIWKGQIAFGLINIPIQLYAAQKKTELSFKLVDSRNKAKIRYERINEETGKEVPWNEIVKAYEVKNKGLIILKEDDFKAAAVENTQTFEIEDFVNRDDVETIYFEKPYYLVPMKQGQKGYVLLRQVLQKTKKAAIGKVVIHTRQYLAMLLPQGEALVLNLLRFASELRSASDLDIPRGNIKNYKISPREVAMAEQLVSSMSVTWNPKKYHDEYKDALLSWIKKKARLGHIPLPKETEEQKPKGAQVIDFMELLKKSLKNPRIRKNMSVKISKPRRTAKKKTASSR